MIKLRVVFYSSQKKLFRNKMKNKNEKQNKGDFYIKK